MTGDDPRPVLRPLSEDLVLVTVSGEQMIIPATCPHRGGRLRFGHVNGRTLRISCPLHHSTFDLRTGERVNGPACQPLRIVDVSPDDVEGSAEAAPWTRPST